MTRVLALVLILSLLPFAAFARCDRKVVERFLQKDNRPCVRWSTGEVDCLGDNDTITRKKGTKKEYEQWRDAEVYQGCTFRVAQSANTTGFKVAMIGMFASMVFDAESTIHVLKQPGTRELNPVFGKHPGRGKLYGIGLSITAAQVFTMYHIKKGANKKNGSRDRKWMFIPVATVGLHTFAGIHNYTGPFTAPR